MKRKLLLSMMLMFLLLSSAWAQRTITGTVSGDGILPGATIQIKGTQQGTQTDGEGKYTLTVPEGSDVLIFSYVGFVPQEETIGNRTVIDVVLKEDQLAEVVVTGLGEATDTRKIGISVEAVNAADLTNSPTISIDQALIGKIPGATIQSVSGQPGQQANIILRGINSLGSTQPMIMVDGVQINTDNNRNGGDDNFSSRLADLDLSNVERVEVIQGAAAGTIYGAQGANGVIQIFTKKGKVGAPQINITSRVGFDYPILNNFRLSNLHAYVTRADGSVEDSVDPETGVGVGPTFGQFTPESQINTPYAEKTFDNIDALFKAPAISYNHGASVSGGSDKTTYALSLSNLDQASIINGKLNRTSARLNVGFNILKNLTASLGSNVIYSKNTTGGITGANNVNSGLGTAVNTPKYIDLTAKDALGNFVGNPAGDNSVNPFYNFNYRKYEARVTRVIQNFNVNFKPFKFLELDYKYGIDHYRYDYIDFIRNQNDLLSPIITPFAGQIDRYIDKGTTQNSLLTAFLRFDVTDDIKSSTQLAFDWRSETFDRIRNIGTGLPEYGEFNTINLGQASEFRIEETNITFITYGYLLNQKFEYKNMLGVSGGVRADFSSAFGRGSKAFVFPRGDVYFRVSELGAFENMKTVMPELKLRAAYGSAGIQPGAFDRIITLDPSNIGSNSALRGRLSLRNPDLNVQVSNEFEAGFDMILSAGKAEWFSYIKPSFTYWTRSSEDIIREIDIAPSTGAETLLTNAFVLTSNGIQASIDVAVFESKDVTWNFTTNFGKSATTVKSISNKADIVVGSSGAGGFVLREGARLGTFFGTVPLTSIDQLNPDGERYIPEDQASNFEVASSGYVVNSTSKAVRFSSDKKVIGDPTPDFTMSFINSFMIKNYLNISFQIDWFQGFDIYNQTRQWLYRDLIHRDLESAVTIGGESGSWVNYYNSLYNVNQVNSNFIEDGSFVRLRDLSIGFDVAKFFKMKTFKSMNVTLSGRNLLTLTNYSGFDPESAAGLNNPEERGLDNYSFPNFRSYNVGVSLGF